MDEKLILSEGDEAAINNADVVKDTIETESSEGESVVMSEVSEDESTVAATSEEVATSVVYVEPVEEIEISVEEAIGWVSGDSGHHYGLPDRNEPDQHIITSITGLREELDEIERLKTVYSDKYNIANYYEWKDATYDEYGYFVSLAPGTSKIEICSGPDIFGVSIAPQSAGFIGGESAEVPRDNRYGLIVTSGLVSVRCELEVEVGDYVVSNARGYAKKSSSDYGYRVFALTNTDDGVLHAVIALGVQADTMNNIGESLHRAEDRIDANYNNIISAVNVANKAYNKSNEATNMSQEAMKDASDALTQSQESAGVVQDALNTAQNAGISAAQARAIAEGAVTAATEFKEEAIARANDAWIKADEIQKEIYSICAKIDEYSVGEYSQAYGLTVEQSQYALKQGMIYAPTETHTEEYAYTSNVELVDVWDESAIEDNTKVYYTVDDNNTRTYRRYESGEWVEYSKIPSYTRSFTAEYLYMWGSLPGKEFDGWITIDKFYNEIDDADLNDSNKSVHFFHKPIIISQYDNFGYWYTNCDAPEDSDGNLGVYEPYTLYKWEDGHWIAVATLKGNVSNRIISEIYQTANEIMMGVINPRGGVAAFDAKITDTESTTQQLAAWKNGEDESKAIIYQETTDGKASIVISTVTTQEGKDSEAKLVLAANEDGSALCLSASSINFTAEDYTVIAEKIDLEGNITISGMKDKIDSAIASTVIEYALSYGSSKEHAPTSGWSVIAPEWESDKYMWQKTTITYVDPNKEPIETVTCIQGARGADGEPGVPGEPGAPGEPGKGITGVIAEYHLSNSDNKEGFVTPINIAKPDGKTESLGWTSDFSEIWEYCKQYSYIWTREKITYTYGDPTYTEPRVDDTSTVIVNWCDDNDKTLISGSHIATGSLSAISANLGTVTSGEIKSPDYKEKTIAHWDRIDDEDVVRDLEYTLSDDGYIVTGIGDLVNESTITIPSSYNGLPVIGIGNNAFKSCENLVAVNISDGITSIGESAFDTCKGLTSITIPGSVISIGDYAFSTCFGLTSITISDGVTSIGDHAFSNCGALTSVTIPDSIEIIKSDAFFGCINLVYTEYDNALYLGNNTNPYVVLIKALNQEIDSCIINSRTKYIYESAFKSCRYLKNITIPDGVTGIGTNAFYYCIGLVNITIPDSIMYIGASAFSFCSSLVYTEYDNALYLGNNTNPYVALINVGVTGATSCLINDNTKYICSSAFYQSRYLTSITIPDSVVDIGELAFYGCDSLTSVTIGNGVTSIRQAIFYNCLGLTNVSIGTNVSSIESYAFYHCSSLTNINIPDSVKSIGDYAFQYCSGLASVTIGNGVRSIGKSAFYGCSSLVSVTIPDNVTSIGDYAFYDCTGITSIVISGSVTKIYGYTFRGCSSLTSIEIPKSVTDIGTDAFCNCSSLVDITILDGVTHISGYAFRNCAGLENVYITDIDKWCNISFGNPESNPLFYAGNLYLNGEIITDFVIPDSVTFIGSYAFYGCTSFTNIIMPKSVKTISNSAFVSCDNLQHVYYLGTEGRWNKISIDDSNLSLINTARYYYSETIPSEPGNYWHYDEDGFKISCDDEYFIDSKHFKVGSNGEVVATKGQIAGWDITESSIDKKDDNGESIVGMHAGESSYFSLAEEGILFNPIRLYAGVNRIGEYTIQRHCIFSNGQTRRIFIQSDEERAIYKMIDIKCLTPERVLNLTARNTETLKTGLTGMVPGIDEAAIYQKKSTVKMLPKGLKTEHITNIQITTNGVSTSAYATYIGDGNVEITVTSTTPGASVTYTLDISYSVIVSDFNVGFYEDDYGITHITSEPEIEGLSYAIDVECTLAPRDSKYENRDFLVLEDGSLYARNASISGQIEADSGNIGDLQILHGGLDYDGNYRLDKEGLIFNKSASQIKIGNNLHLFYDHDEDISYMKANGAVKIQAENGSSIELMMDVEDANSTDYVADLYCRFKRDGSKIICTLWVESNNPLIYSRDFSVSYEIHEVFVYGFNERRTQKEEDGIVTLTIASGETISDSHDVTLKRDEYAIMFQDTENQWTDFYESSSEEKIFICSVGSFTQSVSPTNIIFTGNLVPSQTSTAQDTGYDIGNGQDNKIWNTIYARNQAIQSSDRNKKNSIEPLTDIHTQIFDDLKPVSYKFNVNNNNRTHIGLIAQDVKESIENAGLTTQDFAAYCEWENSDGSLGCGLRYGEFISLCIDQIQKLKKRVEELEEKLTTQND